MKTIFKSVVLLAAIVLSSGSQAQVINGDLNHNGDLDVDDVTLLIDGYLTGETEAIKSTVNPYMVDNSLIAGTWLSDKGQLTFHEDGSLGGFYEGLGYTYKFMPFQKHILLYYDSGKFVAEMKVLELTDETMSLLYEGTYGTYTRIQAVDLGLSVEWANMNIGANAPEDYGDYFAWGETEPKDYNDWSTYKWCNGSKNTLTKYCTDSDFGTVDNKPVLDLEDDAAYANWGGNWRMPTPDEIKELVDNCHWEWTTRNGVNGYKVTGPNGNSIFLPAAGKHWSDHLSGVGSYGQYWSSSLSPKDENYACHLDFYSDGGHFYSYYVRDNGFSVRAVCPNPKQVAVDLGLSVKWATMNVGANAPEESGDYFAWGETEPRHYYYWSNYKWCDGSYNTLTKYCTDSEYGTVDNKTTLDSEDDAAHANWGGSWRMPTFNEIKELESKCSWEWTVQNGVNGMTVTGPNGNSIFLPAAGYHWDSNLGYVDRYGYYWSSTLHQDYVDAAFSLNFDSGGAEWSAHTRCHALFVRAVCPNTTIQPEISLSETSLALKSGETVQLTATVEPVDAGTVTWTSNNESVATVADGFVTAIAEGTAVITAEVAGVQATCSVTVTKPYYEAVDLGLSVKWASMNIGANAPEEYGDYFAWGETKPKDYYDWDTYKWCKGTKPTLTKYCTYSDYGTVDNKTVLDLEDDAARANWGGTWRMPTRAEQDELRTKCTWEWTTLNGVNGCKVIGPNGNSVFLPAAGYRRGSSLSHAGVYGNYWSSSLYPRYDYDAYDLCFDSGGASLVADDRDDGQSVRAVCP